MWHRDGSSSWPRALSQLAFAAVLAVVSMGTLGCPPKTKPPPPPIHYVDAGPILDPCALPGSWIRDDAGSGTHQIPPGPDDAGLVDLSWLTIPVGYCAHHYATVPNARQIRFAPGGELFVSSPSRAVSSGEQHNLGAVVVIPDDNADGVGDSVTPYAMWGSTQGILFANGNLYYQMNTQIWSEPYQAGQRADPGTSTQVADVTVYSSDTHWPKTMDIADDGTIYVGNGGDQGETCEQPMPFHGGIVALNDTPTPDEIAMGLRNPIAVKCHHDGQNHCFAVELGLDGSAYIGGREKLIPIHTGDNWGFPCCATTGLPFPTSQVTCPSGSGRCPADCSSIVSEDNGFLIGNTPFGFDFDDAHFPAPWDHHVMVALHGAVGSWIGAKVVGIQLDSDTGMPLPSWTTDGGFNEGNINDFATGWDDGLRDHGRPSDIAFSADGRMFVANDFSGEIFWVAPLTVPTP